MVVIGATRRAIPALAAMGWLLVAGPVAGDSGGLVISALPVLPPEAQVIEADVIEAGPADPASVVLPVALPDAAALPRRPGLPEPSVILGDLAVLVSMAQRGPMGVPRVMRDNIRQRDAAMFQRLLAGGAFDPDGDQLIAALQTELLQMNCYGGQIDGDWGAGSVEALGRYFQTLGAAQAEPAPDIALFRQIAGHEAVQCADRQPVAISASPAAPAGPRGGSSPPSSGQAAAGGAARAPAQVQPPAESAPRQINPGLIGSGLFR